MVDTLGIVELDSVGRSWSLSQNPHNLAQRRFGDQTLLQWIVRRLSDAQLLDHVAIVSDQSVSVDIPVDVDVVCFEGDPLARVAAAIQKYDAQSIVRVRLIHPFVDTDLIDQLIRDAESHPGVDYISFSETNGRPAVLSPIGMFAEWCSAQAILRSAEIARRIEDRQDATQFVYQHPEHFQLRLIPIPADLDCKDLRLAADRPEDWENMEVILEALGRDVRSSNICGLISPQHQLRTQMAYLNRDQTD